MKIIDLNNRLDELERICTAHFETQPYITGYQASQLAKSLTTALVEKSKLNPLTEAWKQLNELPGIRVATRHHPQPFFNRYDFIIYQDDMHFSSETVKEIKSILQPHSFTYIVDNR